MPEVLQASIFLSSFRRPHCRYLDGAYANHSQPESPLVTSAQPAVGTSIRSAAILLGKLNTDQNSPSRTSTARIEFLYLLKPARDGCVNILGEDSHILASDWLLWLVRTPSLARVTRLLWAALCLSSTSSQLRSGASSIATLWTTLPLLSSPFK